MSSPSTSWTSTQQPAGQIPQMPDFQMGEVAREDTELLVFGGQDRAFRGGRVSAKPTPMLGCLVSDQFSSRMNMRLMMIGSTGTASCVPRVRVVTLEISSATSTPSMTLPNTA